MPEKWTVADDLDELPGEMPDDAPEMSFCLYAAEVNGYLNISVSQNLSRRLTGRYENIGRVAHTPYFENALDELRAVQGPIESLRITERGRAAAVQEDRAWVFFPRR